MTHATAKRDMIEPPVRYTFPSDRRPLPASTKEVMRSHPRERMALTRRGSRPSRLTGEFGLQFLWHGRLARARLARARRPCHKRKTLQIGLEDLVERVGEVTTGTGTVVPQMPQHRQFGIRRVGRTVGHGHSLDALTTPDLRRGV